MLDRTWHSFPLGETVASDKNSLNMGPSECQKLQDLTPDMRRGSLVLRERDSFISSRPLGFSVVDNIGEWKKDNGDKHLVAIASSAQSLSRRLIIKTSSGEWSDDAGGNTVSRQPNQLGTGITSLQILPDSVRAYGESGIGWVGRITTRDADGEDIRVFNSDDSPILVPSEIGSGFAGWDAKVEIPFTPVTGIRIDATRQDGRGHRDVNGVARAGSGNGADSWFGNLEQVAYGVTFVFEGGQESQMMTSGEWVFDTGGATESIYYVELKIGRGEFDRIPYALKAINLYRASNTIETGLNFPPDPRTNGVLIHSFQLYNLIEFNNTSWEIRGQGAFAYVYDINDAVGGTHFNNTIADRRQDPLSPVRAGAKLFGDRGFFWDVKDDTGRVFKTRVYYSHINGYGTNCYDIVLPEDSFVLSFVPFGIVPMYGSYAIIGDTGFAIGHLRGDVSTSWEVSEAVIPIGCRSRKSIAATPFGAVFLGHEGIYIIQGSRADGPIARGVLFYYNDAGYDLDNAHGVYSPASDTYYLSLNSSDSSVILAFDIRGGKLRTITGFGNVLCVGLDSDGYAIVSINAGIYKLERGDGQATQISIAPHIVTGHRRFSEGERGQKITRLRLHYKCDKKVAIVLRGVWNSDEDFTKTLDEMPNEGVTTIEIPASYHFDFAHQIEISADDPESFEIHNLWAEVLDGEMDWR